MHGHATARGQSSTGCAVTFSTRDVVLNCREEYNMQEEGASSKQYVYTLEVVLYMLQWDLRILPSVVRNPPGMYGDYVLVV